MKRTMLAICLLVAALTAASSSLLAGQDQLPNVPGMPTLAQVFVTNPMTQPVPVLIASGGEVQPVTVVGAPTVLLESGATVGVRSERQGWEYQALMVEPGQDPATPLNAAGVDGWEAVGIIGEAAGTRILLKRPR